MNTPPEMRSLAQRIESTIQGNADLAVYETLRAARESVLKIYQEALRPLAGRRLDILITAALEEAEQKIYEQAIAIVTDKLLSDAVDNMRLHVK